MVYFNALFAFEDCFKLVWVLEDKVSMSLDTAKVCTELVKCNGEDHCEFIV